MNKKGAVKPGAVVLDAGAGTGERTLAILEHSQPGVVIALDTSAAMLDVTRSKIYAPRVSFVQGDVCHLSFADGTFDHEPQAMPTEERYCQAERLAGTKRERPLPLSLSGFSIQRTVVKKKVRVFL